MKEWYVSPTATSFGQVASYGEAASLVPGVVFGTLTASIAHEVNQPLSGILINAGTCLRMLSADPPNIDGALQTLRLTIRDGNRASEVIARLRLLFTTKSSVTEPVDLNTIAREAIALSAGEIEKNRVVVCSQLSDDLPLVSGDAVQLQEVILNLIRNAVHAMRGVEERPRQLTARTVRAFDDQVRLSVQDSGVGFDDQTDERLFERFYTTKPDGMGMGLFISRSIIESHQGCMLATANDGPGATFSFSIPCPARIAK
jgi:signal transduction histidine kinase